MNLKDILELPDVKSDVGMQEYLQHLVKLKSILNKKTKKDFNRTNPMSEDLSDWKGKGEQLFGKGKNITVYESCTVVGNVEVGENTWIGPYSALDGNGGLKIGKNCSISAGVNIVSHDSVKWALSGGKHPYEYSAIEIGDNCFIGTAAFISKGVKIGNHVLIGAGAVVTHDVPDFSIAAGVPARIIGKVHVKGDAVELEFFKTIS